MADIERRATATWKGELRGGHGRMSTESGVMQDVPYTFGTRFGGDRGSNPEELIAAAQAACYSMAFADVLASKGHRPESVTTEVTCTMSPLPEGGYRIAKARLETRAIVPGLDAESIERIAREAETKCPVANLLRPGLELELVVLND